MADTKPGIVISSLSKRYGSSKRLAIDSLSLNVNPGEIYGFLGPNGAGKSTTIRILLNFLQPTDGLAQVNGLDVVNDSLRIRQSIGYLSGDMALYPKMTGMHYLSYMSELQGLRDFTYQKELIKRLKPDLDKKMGELSRGNKQKIGIIQALMHKPEVLILDEPTTGLDPLMQEVFYDLLKQAKSRNATIFVSSHILSEVQKMCDRVGIIREGKLVGEREIAELASEATHTFDIEFSGKPPIAKLKKITGVTIQSSDKQSVTLHMHGRLSDLLAELAKHDVTHIDTRSLDLESEFMHFYTEQSDA